MQLTTEAHHQNQTKLMMENSKQVTQNTRVLSIWTSSIERPHFGYERSPNVLTQFD